ncbi:MAG: hypothetical protein COA84_07535 [Robiginitomaculum sp.]|nr:MAG: hypothetical protein COA84_07535 [Robiginitomaculum sp.]
MTIYKAIIGALLLALLGMSGAAVAEDKNIIAHTLEGKKVLLKPDGKWEYVVGFEVNDYEKPSHTDEDVRIDVVLVRIKKNKRSGQLQTEIGITIMVVAEGKILHPRTHRIWGYDAGSPGVGGTRARGTTLTDNYGNRYDLEDIFPENYNSEQHPALRPGKRTPFVITYSGYPVRAVETLTMTLDGYVFGQKRRIKLDIPASLIVWPEDDAP